MVMMLSVMFLGSSQPVLLIIGLIVITLIYSLYMYTMMASYWFSYVLVLVMLSGVLVVFTYMVSLTPNESFEIYKMIFFMWFLILIYNKSLILSTFVSEMVSLNLWMNYIGILSLFMVGFLFSIMIMVVWISCKNMGAMRVY